MMNVFDMIGPIMIGPSSSHTAGAARIGKIARMLLENPVVEAKIDLHGSFAKTYRGHGTDKALVGGILGMDPDDIRIRDSLDLANEENLKISFHEIEIDGAHPNTVRITLIDSLNQETIVQGSSVGGGNIVINRINGMEVYLSGQCPTLIVLHDDRPGTIAEVATYVASHGVNICNFRLNRMEKGGVAIMCIEVDNEIDETINQTIKALPNVIHSIYLRMK